MPLWVEFLRTPMAAPETARLRRLRYGWQALCLVLAASIAGQGRLRGLIGMAAPVATALLMVTAALATIVYLFTKHRADTAFLDMPGEAE